MKNVLILRYYEGQANHVTIIKYPDGQQNVIVDLDYYSPKYNIKINCSIRNFSELEVLLCIIAALKKFDRKVIEIRFSYLFGMRSDRSFEEGQPNYFMDIIAPIIKNLDIKDKVILDPHTEFCAMKCDARTINIVDYYHLNKNNYTIIGGDQSFDNHLIDANFHKTRTFNGIEQELTQSDIFNIELKMRRLNNDNIMILDDLCDGGATFISGSKYLKIHFPDSKLYLCITHGLFTKSIDIVADHFDHIYCSNSYQTINHPKVTQFEVI